jgi:hypothetical protein
MTPNLDDLPRTPQQHFKLLFFGAVLRLRELVRSAEPPVEDVPALAFLGGYFEELERAGMQDGEPAVLEMWERAVADWETRAACHLPLRALREAGVLDAPALSLLLAIGLVEEDPRFGVLFDLLQGGTGRTRPTIGLLTGWWTSDDDPAVARGALRRLLEAGICELVDADTPRSDGAVQLAPAVWDAARGDTVRSLRRIGTYIPPEELPRLSELIVPEAVVQELEALPPLLAAGEVATVIVRGPRASGRRTTLAALAAALDRGLIELKSDNPAAAWAAVGPLATLLHAVPVCELDLAPGETADLARPSALDGPLGIALRRRGGISGAAAEGSVTLALPIPDADARRRHWEAALGTASSAPTGFGDRFRMTGGHIRRTARLARAAAALAGSADVTVADVRRAARSLGRQALDTLATPIAVNGDWGDVSLDADTLEELQLLERRCRHREQLATGIAADSSGVRALFTGPSGTGKSLAGRLLGSVLEQDVYSLNLSTVVDKYIGETEKNLSRVFDCAEELDVILLLDEGDALLTQRTGVQTANDRYANLETNYLLQRLESFEGILIVTTNAPDRIDPAFQRRMDVVIEFRAPDVAERWAIWNLHLPAEHDVDPWLLDEVAVRCAITGGQIQNAVVHATLLALGDDGVIGSRHLEAAVRREYRKAGGTCPLRTGSVVHA